MARVRMTKQRRAVLEVLELNDGEVWDEGGKATSTFLVHLLEYGQPTTTEALIATLSKMQELGLIEREVRGRRTYAIRLPGGHERRLAAAQRASEPEPEQEPVVSQQPILEAVPDQSGIDYAMLAAALLDRVGEVLSDSDREALKVRLGETVDETTRLRTKLRATEDDLRAVTMERDGLRQQKRTLESNVQAMLKGGHDGGQSRRALERFMQQTPHARGA